jgi:RND family efflux transporter MFP subunit
VIDSSDKTIDFASRSTFNAVVPCFLFLWLSTMVAAQTRSVQFGKRSSPQMHEGFTIPKHDILVAASEIGRLSTLTVVVGNRVKTGDIIGILEDGVQNASVNIAIVQSQMTGELDAAKAEVELRLLRVQNLRQLSIDRMARPDELARAEADLKIAIAKHKVAEEERVLRQMDLERRRMDLERRQIFAPMDGVIADVYHKPGEYITPGDPAVVRLLAIDKLYAVFNIPVEEARYIRENSMAKIYLRGAQVTLDSRVSSVAPLIDGESGTVEVRFELDNAKRILLSGDRCTLTLLPSAAGATRSIPTRTAMDVR